MATPRAFMALHGEDLVRMGYQIIRLHASGNTKRPVGDDWQTTRADVARVRGWARNGDARCGIGVLTRETPAVDLDIRDREMAESMGAWVARLLGGGSVMPCRVGAAPKRLYLTRLGEGQAPFAKVSSKVWVDEWAQEHKVEILGDGQQFVAYAVHPDTGREFTWVGDGGDPLTVMPEELPELTEDLALLIVAEFERRAAAAGWERKVGVRSSPGKESRPNPKTIDRDDPFLADTPPVALSAAEIKRKLDVLPAGVADDYETWFQIGMALHHQFGGDDEGFSLWDEWSQGSGKYDSGGMAEKWESFAVEGKNRAPVTARYLLKLAKEHEDLTLAQQVFEYQGKLRGCINTTELKTVCDEIKHISFNTFQRSEIRRILRARYKTLTDTAMPVAEARDMTRWVNPDHGLVLPPWLEPYVYVKSADRFWNRKRHAGLEPRAFNTAYQALLMTDSEKAEGKTRGEATPVDVAMAAGIPVVDDMMYAPGEDEVFTESGTTYVNTFTDRNVPIVPETLSAGDRAAVARAERHLKHLFGDPRERAIVLSVLAFIVREAGKRINWATVLQGVEGDGKSWFFYLMQAVLGRENCGIVDPGLLKGEFNGFAEGHQLAFVEELRQSQSKYDILEKLKPLITNEQISIHRKRMDPIQVRNTQSWIMATNYVNALPIKDTDRRYFAVMSRWQEKDALEEFISNNPTYYDQLYDMLKPHAGALRGWLLGVEYHEDFKPHGRAPYSLMRETMKLLEQDEETSGVEELIMRSRLPSLNPQLVCVTTLIEHADSEIIIPTSRAFGYMMAELHFHPIGQHRIKIGDVEKTRWWAREPRQFQAKKVKGRRGDPPFSRILIEKFIERYHAETGAAVFEDDLAGNDEI
jgi:hypothetical protein